MDITLINQRVKYADSVKLGVKEVWNKLIAFGGTEKFVPDLIEKVIVEGEGVGCIRTIYLKGGGESSAQGGGTMTGGAPHGSAPQGVGAPAGGKPAGGTPQAGALGQAARPVQGGGQPQQGKSAKAQTTLADSLQAGANILDGHWQGTMGPMEMVLDLTTEGNILKGSVQTPRGDQPITDGVVEGDSFTFNLNIMGNSVPYTGKIEGDKITLSSYFRGQPIAGTLVRVQ
ncbi:MAG: hypothetical protein KY428_08980, partial [Bacteroidetes bacterium]|nr:hypothetical protein [Bacteroidota bacterium]